MMDLKEEQGGKIPTGRIRSILRFLFSAKETNEADERAWWQAIK